MKKQIRLISLLLAVLMALSLAACGSNGGDEADGESYEDEIDTETLTADELSIDDFSWKTVKGKSGGEDVYLFSLTNESAYDLLGVSINYKVREDATDEQLNAFSDFAQTYLGEGDSLRDITLWADYTKIVRVGESTGDVILTIGVGKLHWYNAPDDEQFDLMEPNELQIAVVKGNTMYAAYYEFDTEEWLLDSETAEVNVWSTENLGKLIDDPIITCPDAYYIVRNDMDNYLDVDIYGVTKDDLNALESSFKEHGFTNEDGTSDTIFSAENADGAAILANYDESGAKISLSITNS